MKPDSALLEVGRFNGVDTTWETYTKQSPCAASLAISIITAPILSSAPLAMWSAYGAVVSDTAGDSCRVTFSDGSNTYVYTIDTQRWLPFALLITGLTYYNASYDYGYHDGLGLYVLRRVALYRDTTMLSGGVEFHEVYVNGVLEAAPWEPRAVRAAGRAGRSGPVLVVGRDGRRAGAAVDMSGRAMSVPATPGRAWAAGVRLLFRDWHE